MKYDYRLEFSGEKIVIIFSDTDVESEADFMDLVCKELNCYEVFHLTAKIDLLFLILDTHNHKSTDWTDNLKTLLAYGFKVIKYTETKHSPLSKSYHLLKFELSLNGFKPIHYGWYFSAYEICLGQSFVNFCLATEYPPGIHQIIICKSLLKYGGHLAVYSFEEKHSLITLDQQSQCIYANDAVFTYISN